jgi:hypothetical protein
MRLMLFDIMPPHKGLCIQSINHHLHNVHSDNRQAGKIHGIKSGIASELPFPNANEGFTRRLHWASAKEEKGCETLAAAGISHY